VGRILQWILPVVGTAIFYLVGQTMLLIALRYTTASRVAPLLGLKVIGVATLTVVVLGDHVAFGQWLAVGLAVVGAFVLNYTGGSLPLAALAAIGGACLGYTGSDFHIRLTIEAMPDVPPLGAAVFAMAATYLICGLIAAPLLPIYGSRDRGQWIAAAPYSLAWLIAMTFLFLCFAAAGLVLGNIVQSMRGLISIGLGGVLASYGLVHLETRLTPSVFWRRFAAAVLMTAAVALFVVAGGD
ncbi:MAG: EamA family transporter, partial [Phycisphaeraceae bacterium]